MPKVAAKSDPIDPERQAIFDKLGDLFHVKVAQNEFLMAIYVRSTRTPSGIFMTDKSVKEDVYQGKVGLVVKIGEACKFVRTDSASGRSYGIPVKLYDWVVVRPADTWAIEINAHPQVLAKEDFVVCRLVYDDMVRMVVDYPGMIW